MTSLSRPLEITLDIPVRGYDIDFAGVVSNIVYIRWLEDMRSMMLDAFLPLEKQMAQGHGPILASTRIDYKHPIRLFDKPRGIMWLSELGRARWVVQAEVWVDDLLTTTAQQSGVFIEYDTMTVIKVPDAVRLAFEKAATSPA